MKGHDGVYTKHKYWSKYVRGTRESGDDAAWRRHLDRHAASSMMLQLLSTYVSLEALTVCYVVRLIGLYVRPWVHL